MVKKMTDVRTPREDTQQLELGEDININVSSHEPPYSWQDMVRIFVSSQCFSGHGWTHTAVIYAAFVRWTIQSITIEELPSVQMMVRELHNLGFESSEVLADGRLVRVIINLALREARHNNITLLSGPKLKGLADLRKELNRPYVVSD